MVNFIIESTAFGPLERPFTIREESTPKFLSGSNFEIVASSVTSTINGVLDESPDPEALVAVVVDAIVVVDTFVDVVVAGVFFVVDATSVADVVDDVAFSVAVVVVAFVAFSVVVVVVAFVAFSVVVVVVAFVVVADAFVLMSGFLQSKGYSVSPQSK
jgi:hypothetical protein